MAQPTEQQIAPIDDILTQMSVAYRNAVTGFVADRVFPLLPVSKDSGVYGTYDKAFTLRNEMKPRAYGSEYAQFGYETSTASYTTMQYGLEHVIADELRKLAQIPFSLERDAMELLMDQVLLKREIDFAALAFASGTWATTKTDATVWTDYSSSTPISDVRTAVDTIAAAGVAVDQIVMVMGRVVKSALLDNPDIKERIIYVQMATQANIETAMAAIFGVREVITAEAIRNTAAEGLAFSSLAIIDDDCLIVQSPPAPSLMKPCGGFTFTWQDGGGAGSFMTYRDERREGDVVQAKQQYGHGVVAPDAGYLFTGIV